MLHGDTSAEGLERLGDTGRSGCEQVRPRSTQAVQKPQSPSLQTSQCQWVVGVVWVVQEAQKVPVWRREAGLEVEVVGGEVVCGLVLGGRR